MDFRIKTTPKVKQSWFQFEIPFINRTIRFTVQLYKSPKTWTTGISSRCKDGRHVVFIDYDKQEFKQVFDEIKFLQQTFNLSRAYFFKTGVDSFHVIFLDKLPLLKVFEILQASNCEWSYLNSVKLVRGREWVLRIAEKGKRKRPRFFCSVHSNKKQKNPISTAHKLFLVKWHGVQNYKYDLEDNITEIPVIDYTTGNRVG